MNKRIVILDPNVDSVKFFGRGLGEIYTTTQLEQDYSEDEQKDLMNLSYGDGVMLVGSRAFEYFRKFHHLGIRSENYFDCSLLTRLGMETGAFAKVVHEDDEVTKNDIEFFMSSDFCKVRTFPDLKYEVIKTYERMVVFMEYFESLPTGTLIGFDFETSGMPMKIDFKVTGFAFALAYSELQVAAFFSWTELERFCTEDQFNEFLERFKRVLVKHHENIWVYNRTFETQVCWRLFRLELNFNDASVFNFEDGIHTKNFSLKWTGQRLLGGGDKYKLPGLEDKGGIVPWDTNFDLLESAFSRLYFYDIYEKGKKKPVGKSYKCSEYDWELQPEWKEIKSLFPEYEDEFRYLVNHNFGNPFLNMPADILGKYCCLDSFYTALIALENLPRYSKLCHETFLNNQKIYSALERGGLYIDDPFRKDYESYCHKMMLWGISYVATYRCRKKIEEHSKKAAKLERYPANAQILLKKREFCNGMPEIIARNLLAQNVDQSEIYETGLDEGGLVMKYGNKFASGFAALVKSAIEETKFKGKIDDTVARKKKLIGAVAEKLIPFLGLDKIKLTAKHQELEKLLYYQEAYKELMGIWKQIPNIDNIPEQIYWRGKKTPIYDVAEDVMTEYYRCSSPIDNVVLEQELIAEFKLETTFLSTIYRDINKLPGEKNYYAEKGITNPTDAMEHFGNYCHVYYQNKKPKTGICLWPQEIKNEYPMEIYDLFNQLYNDPKNDWVTETWGDWKGWDKQADFFPELVKNEIDIIGENWKEEDLELNRFTLMRKLLIAILLFKKYNKLRSTYICDTGLFNSGSKYVIDTPQLMPVRDAKPDEPGAVKKTFLNYRVMNLETKRSSSGFHTIPSHMDAKSCITCPVIDTPGTRTGKTATLLSYFDINKLVSPRSNLREN